MLVCAGVVFAFIHKEAMASQLHAWKLLPRAELLTELYFTQPGNLTDSASTKDSRTVAFTIHNLEQKRTEYHYTILTTRVAGSERVLGDGDVTLAPGESQDISRTLKIPTAGNRTKIVVRLEYNALPFGHDTPILQAQTIHYWIKATDLAAEKEGT